jgi:hypothetical protein
MAEIKRFVTPVFRLSFPNVFEPKEGMNGGKPKFGISAIWTPAKFTDKEKVLWKNILKALDAEAMHRFKKPFKSLPANIKRGLRNGNERPDLEGYGEGTLFASVTSKMKPGVIDRDRSEISVEENNTEKLYPGCKCRATVTVYGYDNQGKGLALGLLNLQKVDDGKRLDSRVDAAEDFEDDLGDGEENDNLLDKDDDDIAF